MVILNVPGAANVQYPSSLDIAYAVDAADKANWTSSEKDVVSSTMSSMNAEVHPFCHTIYKYVDYPGDWWNYECKNSCLSCDKVDVVVDSADGYLLDVLEP